METTKRRHIDLLTSLDSKKKRYNLDPTDDENELLGMLLRDHDEEVAAFASASAELKRLDGGAHKALFEYIGTVTAGLSNGANGTEH